MMRRLMLAGLLLLVFVPVAAGWEVTGSVLEKGTRAPLAEVNVAVKGLQGVNAITDAQGVFHLSLPGPGDYELEATFAGSQATTSISLKEQTPPPVPIIYLRKPATLGETVVTAQRMPDRVSRQVISGKTLRQLAGSSGDPLRSLQSLPGVVTVEGRSAPAVRGSGPGENLYYVDGLYVGNLFHYESLSVLNADLVQAFDLYGAAFSPHYGDVTGAVIDVTLRNPRKDRMGTKLDINMTGANFLVEGPHGEDKSFYFAARRSYADLLIRKVELDRGMTVQIPSYWDYQGKYLWQLNGDNRLSLHLLGTSDVLKLDVAANGRLGQQEPVLVGETSLSEENATQGVVLDTVFPPAALNTFTIEHIHRAFSARVGTAGVLNTATDHWQVREQARLELAKEHELSLGVELGNTRTKINIDFKNTPCTQFEPHCDLTTGTRKRLVEESSSPGWSLSLQDRKQVLERLTLVGGIRRSFEGYLHRSYTEPRVGLEWEWSKDTLLTAGWGRHNQMPTPQQVAREFGNPHLRHIRADHSVLGVAHKVNADWNWKVEAYYKKFSDLVVSDPLLNYINAGSGRAWGMELLIKKEETDKLSGWWVLNLARSTRRNEVTGEHFRFQYDQPVNTTLVGTYRFSDEWALSMKWALHSGTPYTPVLGTSGTYPDGRPIPVYGGVNSGTLPLYHRLDLRLDRNYVFDRWKLSAYYELNNVYQRKNVVGYAYDPGYTQREPVYAFVLPFSFGMLMEF